jgi:phosphate transport system permease protein
MSTLSLTRTLTARRLPAWAPWAVAAGASVVSFLLFRVATLLGGGWTLTFAGAVLLYLVGMAVAATLVEGSRKARDRVAGTLVYSALVLAMLPLLSVTFTLVSNGVDRLDGEFFSHSNRNITAFDAGGGAYHAIIGTLEQVAIATVLAVPLGLVAAIFIVEYAGTSRRLGGLANAVRFVVDVMTGIPSIVAGLFILSFWVLVVSPHLNNGRPQFSGFAAGLALTVLMLPTVTRSSEEMLRLVPDALREASFALGVPKWKTISRIVLPTALPGIVTGVMLAVARAAGETAPVLLVAGGSDSINMNPFAGGQASLATYIYSQAGLASKYGPPRAWTAALTLVALVLTLTIAAKLLARRNTLTR